MVGDGNWGGDDVKFSFYLLLLIIIGYYFIDEVKKYYWTFNDIKSALDFDFPYHSTKKIREIWYVDLREAGWGEGSCEVDLTWNQWFEENRKKPTCFT